MAGPRLLTGLAACIVLAAAAVASAAAGTQAAAGAGTASAVAVNCPPQISDPGNGGC